MSITKLSPKQLDTLISAMEAHHMAMGGMVQATSRPFMFQGHSGPVKKFEEGGSTSEGGDGGGSGPGGSYTHADDVRQDAAQDAGDRSLGSGSSGWGGERSSEASRSEPSGSGSSSSSGMRSEAGSEGSPLAYDNSSASAVAGLMGGAGNGQENVPDYGSSLRSEAALGSLVGSSDLGPVPPAMVGSGFVEPPQFAKRDQTGGYGADAPPQFHNADGSLMSLNDTGRVMGAIDKLQSEGLSLNGAIGMTANGKYESGLNPSSDHWDVNGPSGGLFQWHDITTGRNAGTLNRLSSLLGAVGEPGAPISSETIGSGPNATNPGLEGTMNKQLEYAVADTKNNYPELYRTLTDPTISAGNNASQFVHDFENPAQVNNQMAIRSGIANAIAKDYADMPRASGVEMSASAQQLPSASVQASPNILSSLLGVSPAFAGYSAPVSPLASADGMPTSANAYTGLKTPNQSIETSAFMPSAQTADYIHLLSPSNYEGNTPNYSRALSMAMNDPTVGVQYGSPSSGSMGQGITPQASAYQGMPWSGGQSQDYHDRNLAGLSGVGNDYHDQNLAGLNNVGSNPVPDYHDMNLAGLSGVGPSSAQDYHDQYIAGLNGVGSSPSGDMQSAYNDPRDPSQGYDPLSGRMTPGQYDRYTLASSFGNAPPPSANASQDQSGGSNYPLARMPMSPNSYGDMPNPGYGLPGMVDPSALANAMRPPNEFGAPLDKFAFNDGNDRDPGGSPAARLHHLNDGGAHIATEGPGFENRGDIPPRSGVDPTNNGQVNPRWSDSTPGKIAAGIGNAGLGFFGGPLGSAAVMGDKLISGQTPGTQLINALQRGYENGTWAPGAPQINDHTNMASSAYDRSGGYEHPNIANIDYGTGDRPGSRPYQGGQYDYGTGDRPGNSNSSGGYPFQNGTGSTSTLPALIQAALRTRAEDPIDYEHYGMKPMHSYYNYS